MGATDKLTATHDRLVEAVGQLATGEDWRAMLEVSRRFHTYSLSNVLLITAQRPDATRVAGYSTWKRLGRQVRRGEHGIAILAPVTYRTPAGGTGPTEHAGLSEEGRAEQGSKAEGEDTSRARHLRAFRVAHVFDIAQTEGEDLPEVRPATLEDAAPEEVFARLVELLQDDGYQLLRADCSPANGRTHFLSRTVVVRADLPPAQALKTLAHELAHVRLHEAAEHRQGGRAVAEVEAESVAYLVCAAAGIESAAYSFPYVARWADGDVALVRSTASRAVACARRIIDQLTPECGAGDIAGEAGEEATGEAGETAQRPLVGADCP